MTLNLCTLSFSRLISSPPIPKSSSINHNANSNTLFFSTSSIPNLFKPLTNANNASVSESHNEVSNDTVSNSDQLLDQKLLLRIAATAKDADEVLNMIAENSASKRGVVCISDCCSVISTALKRNNHELAFSVFYAMRATFDQAGDNVSLDEGWKWSRPNADVYMLLIQGLAASLRVSDALTAIKYICEVAVSPGEEVRFGKIVRCPSCRIAVGVAQPQQDSVLCEVSLPI